METTMEKLFDYFNNSAVKVVARKILRDVDIRPADPEGELVTTVLADGHTETKNAAMAGDYVVTGVNGEQYVIKESVLEKKYDHIEGTHYRTKPVEVQGFFAKSDCYFKASWGETMHMRTGDFIVCNSPEDVYGIAQKEFYATYETDAVA